MVPELHAMRIVCLLKAVTTAWVTNTFPFLLVNDYKLRPGLDFVLRRCEVLRGVHRDLYLLHGKRSPGSLFYPATLRDMPKDWDTLCS